jgi:hypothetical protein
MANRWHVKWTRYVAEWLCISVYTSALNDETLLLERRLVIIDRIASVWRNGVKSFDPQQINQLQLFFGKRSKPVIASPSASMGYTSPVLCLS